MFKFNVVAYLGDERVESIEEASSNEEALKKLLDKLRKNRGAVDNIEEADEDTPHINRCSVDFNWE